MKLSKINDVLRKFHLLLVVSYSTTERKPCELHIITTKEWDRRIKEQQGGICKTAL